MAASRPELASFWPLVWGILAATLDRDGQLAANQGVGIRHVVRHKLQYLHSSAVNFHIVKCGIEHLGDAAQGEWAIEDQNAPESIGAYINKLCLRAAKVAEMGDSTAIFLCLGRREQLFRPLSLV